ncbi:MAG: hypothetical protein ABIH83_05865 [Candidatus Micrarchaeota archaeon]
MAFFEKQYSDSTPNKLSFSHAAKYGLWGAVVVFCIIGMIIGLLGGVASYFALGAVANSVVAPIDNAKAAMGDASLALANFSEMSEDANSATQKLGSSLRTFGKGVNSSANSFSAIAGLQIGGIGIAGLDEAVEDMRQSAGYFYQSADEVEGMGSDAQEGFQSFSAASMDLQEMSISLETSKRQILDGIGLLQIAFLAFALAIECMLASCLALALAYGPPKAQEKKK